MSVKYCLPVPVFHFWPKLTHPTARSLGDGWATCLHCGLPFFHRKLFFYHVYYHSFLQCWRRLRLEVRKERTIFWRCLSLNYGAVSVPRQPKNSRAATADNMIIYNALFTLFVQTLSYQLTCAVNAITGESLIAFTPVTHRPSRGAHVRCNWSTCGVLMTDSRCIGSAAPRIWFHIYTKC